ncbi:MAG: hypothetical protein ABJE95_25975 [Byssovorax sp.]
MISTALRSRARSAPLLLALVSACASAPPISVPAHDDAPVVASVAPLIVAAPEPPPAVAPLRPPQPPPLTVAGNCSYAPPPPTRIAGDLSVSSPPRPRTRTIPTRMRTDVEGSLSHGSPRTWVGRDVPPFVLVEGGTRELTLLDQAPDGFVGLYRDPYGASSCNLSNPANCSFGVALFECVGKTRWLLLLDPFFSRKDHLEVQDVRYADGILYFNEACQSYSKEANGQCSSLVAIEPLTKTLLWRTQPLVSNATFLVAGRYLITGYGFTAEPDALFIVRRSDGKVMSRVSIPTAHHTLDLDGSGVLRVSMWSGPERQFRAEGFDGDHPRLVQLPTFRN